MVRYCEYPSPTITTDNHIRKSVKKFIINHVRKLVLSTSKCVWCVSYFPVYMYTYAAAAVVAAAAFCLRR